jgi:hypothetical protein
VYTFIYGILKTLVMTRLQKIIIGINLLILTFYSVSFYLERGQQHLAILFHAFVIACHVSTLIFAGTLSHFLAKKEISKAFWLSAGIVLLIGFGSCVVINN